jgi:hypothetical protein
VGKKLCHRESRRKKIMPQREQKKKNYAIGLPFGLLLTQGICFRLRPLPLGPASAISSYSSAFFFSRGYCSLLFLLVIVFSKLGIKESYLLLLTFI